MVAQGRIVLVVVLRIVPFAVLLVGMAVGAARRRDENADAVRDLVS